MNEPLHLLIPCDHGWRFHCGLPLADVPEGCSIPLEFFSYYKVQLCPVCARWPNPPVLDTRTTPGPQPSIKDQAKARMRTTETERSFMARVIAEANQAGYLVYHTFNAKRSPKGFPDVVLAKAGSPILLCELKTERGKVTPEQATWLEVLASVTGVESHLWRPDDWATIVQTLHHQEA